jgi:hypothetical protein
MTHGPHVVQRLRLLSGSAEGELRRPEGSFPAARPGHLVVVIRAVREEDRGRVARHRRVHEDRERRDLALLLELAQREEHLLRAPDRERGHDDRTLPDRAPDLVGEGRRGEASGWRLPP